MSSEIRPTVNGPASRFRRTKPAYLRTPTVRYPSATARRLAMMDGTARQFVRDGRFGRRWRLCPRTSAVSEPSGLMCSKTSSTSIATCGSSTR